MLLSPLRKIISMCAQDNYKMQYDIYLKNRYLSISVSNRLRCHRIVTINTEKIQQIRFYFVPQRARFMPPRRLAADTSCHSVLGCAPGAFAIVFEAVGSTQVVCLFLNFFFGLICNCVRDEKESCGVTLHHLTQIWAKVFFLSMGVTVTVFFMFSYFSSLRLIWRLCSMTSLCSLQQQNPVRGEKNTRSETHCSHENQAHKEIIRMIIIKVLFRALQSPS